ncbi:MAG TPA: DUF6036 family nucleotidyltransferase [Ramlibacter sp.]|nr:DUF6036 family nucleotidyltransferase [Ramlibacter sp.]
MNVDALFALLTEAKKLCKHSEYVVVGSLSVLGMSDVTAIPGDMTMSIDADCYTLRDPGRVLDLQAELGEGSPFHQQHGIYLDPVNPKLPTLPDGWETRLIKVGRGGVVAHFLEPHDAAVSKLARGEERDFRWVLAGAKGNILALPTVAIRMKSTGFLDDAEKQAALALLDKAMAALQAGK